MTTRGDERIVIAAKAAHDAYEEYAPEFGYDTRQESAVPWEELPKNHQALMCVSIGAALAAADGVSPPQPDAIENDATREALVLAPAEWTALARVARSFLDSGNEWAERDEDEEALEIRAARDLCRRIEDVS